MQLYVSRHAVTGLNKEGRVNGRIDESLSEEGFKQAAELADELVGKSIDVIYSSPLLRTIQTAEPISNRMKIPVLTDDRIIELDFGTLSGKTQAELVEIIGSTMMDSLSSYKYDFRKYMGESFDEVYKRVSSFIADIKGKNQNALVITHGGIVRMINYVCTGEKIGYQDNAKIIRYTL